MSKCIKDKNIGICNVNGKYGDIMSIYKERLLSIIPNYIKSKIESHGIDFLFELQVSNDVDVFQYEVLKYQTYSYSIGFYYKDLYSKVRYDVLKDFKYKDSVHVDLNYFERTYFGCNFADLSNLENSYDFNSLSLLYNIDAHIDEKVIEFFNTLVIACTKDIINRQDISS